ncbi:MAG: nonstructural protein [Arizlama microvirus]|nr:MAG: nonstructural protein [Arizlama microvirus]
MRKVYGVWDVKGQDFLGPLFLFANDAVAGRSVADACSDGTQLRAHPEDYRVVALGTVDIDGKMTAFDVPQVVVSIEQLIIPSGPREDSPRDEQRVLSLEA